MVSNLVLLASSISAGRGSSARIDGLSSIISDANTKVVPLISRLKDIQIDTIQVQQFLTDASLTHEVESFKSAETFRQAFDIDVAAATALAADLGLDGLGRHLAALRGEFPAYYNGGRHMADVYVRDGVVAGNAVMKEFDGTCLLYTSPSPRDGLLSRMPSSA